MLDEARLSGHTCDHDDTVAGGRQGAPLCPGGQGQPPARAGLRDGARQAVGRPGGHGGPRVPGGDDRDPGRCRHDAATARLGRRAGPRRSRDARGARGGHAPPPRLRFVTEQPAPYHLAITPTARRQLTENLPEAVAAAAYEFITGPLLDNPHRVGKRLRLPLEDPHSARRGTYRVIYRIDDDIHRVTVVDVAHRRNAYRSGR